MARACIFSSIEGCGITSPDAPDAKTEFHVSNISELVSTLNDKELDRGDTIYMSDGVYDLYSAENTGDKITNGILHVGQGITITKETNMSKTVDTVTLKGSVSIETSNVTLKGLNFENPSVVVRTDETGKETKSCIIASNSGGFVDNLIVEGCTYEEQADAEFDPVFMVIEGVNGADINSNTVTGAGIIVLGGVSEQKTAKIRMLDNMFTDFTIEVTPDSMSPDEQISFLGTVIKDKDGKEITNVDEFVKGDTSMITDVHTGKPLSVTMTYEAGQIKISASEQITAVVIEAQYDEQHRLIKAETDTVDLPVGITEYPRFNTHKYEMLSFAIILRAIKDYRNAVKNKNPGVKMECERFFKSKWYDMLTTLPGDVIISRLRAEERGNTAKKTTKTRPTTQSADKAVAQGTYV